MAAKCWIFVAVYAVLIDVAPLSLSGQRVNAEGVFPQTNQFVCQVWRVEDGLPENSVRAIVQTRDGYLWVGTGGGLAQFDGVGFKVFGMVEGLPSLNVRVLLEDRQGALWIGTADGLCRLQSGRFTSWTTRDGLAGNTIDQLAEDHEGALWIVTPSGVCRRRDERFEIIGAEAGLAKRSVLALVADQSGAIWVTTQERGLLRWDGAAFVAATVPQEIQGFRPSHLLTDHAGRIWAAADNQIVCIEGSSLKTHGSWEVPHAGSISCLAESTGGTIWAGTWGHGLYYLREGKVRPVRQSNGLSDEAVRVVMEDRERNLWVGTRGAGLNRLQPRGLSMCRILDGDTEARPVCLAQAPDGGLLAGTLGRGFFRFTGSTAQPFPRQELPISRAQSGIVFVAQDGSLWCNSGTRLVHWKEGEPVVTYNSDVVGCLCEDRQEGLWVGTRSGTLQLLRQGEFLAFTNGLPRAPLTALVQEPDGTLWVGSYGGGLGRLKDGHGTIFGRQHGLASDFIHALLLDSEGTLWIGTEGGGLGRFKAGRITSFSKGQGLGDDTVLQILEEAGGHLWLGGYRGIFRVSRRELDDLAAGTISYIHPRVFGHSDGMESEECSVGFGACLKTRAGLLYFSTVRGIVMIDPKQQTDLSAPPIVRLEEILVDGQSQSFPAGPARSVRADGTQRAALSIPPGRQRFEFHYMALCFSAPEKVRFRYRLEGLDRDWVEAGAGRVAYYSYVPPGRYRFEVVAHNGSGVWGETGASVALAVRPHFWQTWWFITLAGIGLLGAAAGTARYIEKRKVQAQMRRLELERAMGRERARIARDIHDNLGALCTEISMETDLAEQEIQACSAVSAHVRSIHGTVGEMLRQLDETVWAVNPRNDQLDRLADYILQYAERFFRHATLRCRLKVLGDVPALPIAAEPRHHMFLAVKEALNNAARHSGATELELHVAFSEPTFAVTVRDNGRGFAAAEGQALGRGLENMRSRMEHLRGRFYLQTQPGQGTTIRMEFDVTAAQQPKEAAVS